MVAICINNLEEYNQLKQLVNLPQYKHLAQNIEFDDDIRNYVYKKYADKFIIENFFYIFTNKNGIINQNKMIAFFEKPKNFISHKKFINKQLEEDYKNSQIEQVNLLKMIAPEQSSSKFVNVDKLKQNYENYVKIDINPIGFIVSCSQNSYNTWLYDDTYNIEYGFSISGFDNGEVFVEPHFVNFRIIDGKKIYYDFTKDINNDTHRYFIRKGWFNPKNTKTTRETFVKKFLREDNPELKIIKNKLSK